MQLASLIGSIRGRTITLSSCHSISKGKRKKACAYVREQERRMMKTQRQRELDSFRATFQGSQTQLSFHSTESLPIDPDTVGISAAQKFDGESAGHRSLPPGSSIRPRPFLKKKQTNQRAYQTTMACPIFFFPQGKTRNSTSAASYSRSSSLRG